MDSVIKFINKQKRTKCYVMPTNGFLKAIQNAETGHNFLLNLPEFFRIDRKKERLICCLPAEAFDKFKEKVKEECNEYRITNNTIELEDAKYIKMKSEVDKID